MGKMIISRVGEKRMMNCGMEAEIIAYRNALDIDVQLSDGRIVKGCRYNAFKRGSINGLGIRTVSIRTSKKRIGEKRMMNCGLEGEIIAYRGCEDMDIRMSDGRIVRGCTYGAFKRSEISGLGAGSHGVMTLKNNKFRRIGEKRMMNCGLEAEIIAYRACSDIDVRLSDGSIYEHKQYWAFSNGKIGPHHRSAAKK